MTNLRDDVMCTEQWRPITLDLDAALESERPRLIRLCAYLTGDPAAADDLAQETLVVAWRNAHKLTDSSGLAAWVSAIARNVCRRWQRAQGQTSARTFSLDAPSEAGQPDIEPASPFDFEVELERGELATLLDRALALLPAATRDVLIAHYIADSPLAEVAKRLGQSEGNVAVRLHRGRVALRHIMTTTFQDEARSHGLIHSDTHWQLTRIWCPSCGNARLMGHLNAAAGELFLRCPACEQYGASGDINHSERLQTQIGGATGFKTAYTRLMKWSESYYQPGLQRGSAQCTLCGRDVRAHLTVRDGHQVIDASCPDCDGRNYSGVGYVALSHKHGRAFWSQHPRLRLEPAQSVHFGERPALLFRLASVMDAARLDVILDAENLRPLHFAHTQAAQ